nr:DUF805 domain-containing protein [uncultured Cohaesibacter sp.]
MNLATAINTVFFKKYATFSGRAQRSEYWWWALAVFAIGTAAQVIDFTFLASEVRTMRGPGFFSVEHNGPLSVIVTLATLVPNFAAMVRRLHDSDKSGWWFLIIFIPLLGVLYFFYLLIRRGTDGPNRFGPDPLDPNPHANANGSREARTAPAGPDGRRYRGMPDSPVEEEDQLAVPEEAQRRRPPSVPTVAPNTKDAPKSRPSWRTPNARKDSFQTTQERFKDK